MALLNTGSVIALWLAASTCACLHYMSYESNALVKSLLFFNNLNILIAACEIVLGLHIMLIKDDYTKLRTKYGGGKEWEACVAYLTMPLKVGELLDGKLWSRMWSTYSLYDPSYQNHESFGFFIDFGNGLSTIPPSVLFNLAMVFPEKMSPLFVGCLGVAMYWQVMYGTIIYVLSFMFNRRYEGKSLTEVCLFVGVSNSLWFFFPILGIYASVCMLRDGNMSVFGQL